jgi:hypothetical protein
LLGKGTTITVLQSGILARHLNLREIQASLIAKHQDFALFNGTNPEVITAKNATSNDGKISSIQSVGYNLRYTPKVGFGYEAGLYFTKIKMPRQNAALKHSDGSPFTKQTATGAEAKFYHRYWSHFLP